MHLQRLSYRFHRTFIWYSVRINTFQCRLLQFCETTLHSPRGLLALSFPSPPAAPDPSLLAGFPPCPPSISALSSSPPRTLPTVPFAGPPTVSVTGLETVSTPLPTGLRPLFRPWPIGSPMPERRPVQEELACGNCTIDLKPERFDD